MTITSSSTPARSDLAASTTDAPTASAVRKARPYRWHGMALTGGAVLWAVALALYGVDPTQTAHGPVGFMIGSGAFQIGLLMLLRVLARTQALGTGKFARRFLAVENVLVGLAIASTVADGLELSDLSQPGWALLDAFWPISMIGMFVIAIRIAVAGRWTGASRYWPLIAESWAVCVIPTLNLFGAGVAQVVAVVHLLIGYSVLGQIVARKPQ